MREKLVSYKITVTPPSKESLLESRRSRATTCLKVVQADMKKETPRLEAVQKQKTELDAQVKSLEKQLEEKKKELEAAKKEETTLKERKALRVEQEKRLNERLKNGWKDEAAAAATAAPKANGTKK